MIVLGCVCGKTSCVLGPEGLCIPPASAALEVGQTNGGGSYKSHANRKLFVRTTIVAKWKRLRLLGGYLGVGIGVVVVNAFKVFRFYAEHGKSRVFC